MKCPKCNSNNAIFKGRYYAKKLMDYQRRLICKDCGKYFVEKYLIRKCDINLECPRCLGKKITFGSRYYVRTLNKYEQRYSCITCKKTFINRIHVTIRKYGDYTIKKVLELYNTNKGHINKYDNLKKITYSTREIAKILKISSSGVFGIIKRMHNEI